MLIHANNSVKTTYIGTKSYNNALDADNNAPDTDNNNVDADNNTPDADNNASKKGCGGHCQPTIA